MEKKIIVITRSVGLLLAASALLWGCGSNDDINARYSMEKKMWKAQKIEKSINADFRAASEKDIEHAIKSYEDVIDGISINEAAANGWRPLTMAEINRLIVLSKIALANLYFITDKYFLAEDYYRSSLYEEDIPELSRLNARLNLARSFYFTGFEDSLEIQCESLFRELVLGAELWQNQPLVSDAFLEIPLMLVKLYKAGNKVEKYREYDFLASSFYDKIIHVWPDSLIADKARFKKTSMYLLAGNWEKALNMIDAITTSSFGRAIAPKLLLLKAGIYLKGIKDSDSAERIYLDIAVNTPDAEEAFTAKLALSGLYFNQGKNREALELIRSIKKDGEAPEEAVSRAMLLHALYLEEQDKWEEAILVLKRIQTLYPQTQMAMEAPLLITVHYIESGDSLLAHRNLEKASRFYITLIARAKAQPERALISENYLVENYLVAGRAAEAAEILSSRAEMWGWPAGAAALIKSAGIYSRNLEDVEKAREALKKCIELYPETRYAKRAGTLLSEN